MSGDQSRAVTHGKHAIVLSGVAYLSDRPRDAVKSNGNGAVVPRVVKDVAAIGSQSQFQPQSTRFGGEGAGLVTGSRGNQEESLPHN
jgi:hypothetical protein